MLVPGYEAAGMVEAIGPTVHGGFPELLVREAELARKNAARLTTVAATQCRDPLGRFLAHFFATLFATRRVAASD
jgi:hypothetical protein